MSKAIMLSVRSKYCELIAYGKKTIEVRKTKPKLIPPFKCYIYCTKNGYEIYGNRCMCVTDKSGLLSSNEAFKAGFKETSKTHKWNGKVIGEFVCDRIEILFNTLVNPANYMKEILLKILKETALSYDEFAKYVGSRAAKNNIYGWHISDIVIYDKPMELSDFYFPPELYCEKERCGGCPKDQVMGLDGDYAFDCEWKRPLVHAPQSWCYVEEAQ